MHSGRSTRSDQWEKREGEVKTISFIEELHSILNSVLDSVISELHNTVEPPNKGQVGAWALVHYSGVVLYWGVFVKKPFVCVVSVYS